MGRSQCFREWFDGLREESYHVNLAGDALPNALDRFVVALYLAGFGPCEAAELIDALRQLGLCFPMHLAEEADEHARIESGPEAGRVITIHRPDGSIEPA